MKTVFKIVLGGIAPLIILGLGGGMAWYIMRTAPEVERSSAPPQAPVVEVVAPDTRPFQRLVEAFGSVQPAREVGIAPEISGRVLEIHPNLEPGGIIKADDVLIRIDPAEYELALEAAKGALAEAQAALEVEQGRQRVAQREWELFGKDLPEAELSRDLALREPQLRQAEARIASAKSAVDRAQLDLDRTVIRAPFDAMVLEESVDPGQLAREGAEVARLIGTNSFWVLASIPTSRLSAVLETARSGDQTAQLYSDVDTSAGQPPRPGRLVRHLGQVDPDGRMAQVLVEIDDPLHLADDADTFPLPLNSYVRIELGAGTLEGIAAVPRRALRENNEVWVSDAEDKLAVRTVDIIWPQGDQLAVENTFESGDQLIVSPLADALPGMALRPRTGSTQAETGETS
jgi:RND family efflux transporter MFP subunit